MSTGEQMMSVMNSLRLIDNFGEALEERDGQKWVLKREFAEVKAKYQVLHWEQFKPHN